MSPEEIAALLSCLVHDESNKEAEKCMWRLKTKMTTFETREIIHQRNRGYQCQLPNRGVTYKPMHII